MYNFNLSTKEEQVRHNRNHWARSGIPPQVRQNGKEKYHSIKTETLQWFEELGSKGFERDLILLGPVGTHKTTDAMWGAVQAYQAGLDSGSLALSKDVVYRTMTEFVDDVFALKNFNTQEKADKRIEEMFNAELLIFDEFMQAVLDETAFMKLSKLITHRDLYLLPTVYISNDPKIGERLKDKRLQDRLAKAKRVIYSGDSDRDHWSAA